LRFALALLVLCSFQASAEERVSWKGRFKVELRSAVEPPPVNKLHRWEGRVLRVDGRVPMLRALEVDGGMPAHGHGLPSAPTLTQLGEGRFVVEGMKFNMPGSWVLKVMVADAAGADGAEFQVEVPPWLPKGAAASSAVLAPTSAAASSAVHAPASAAASNAMNAPAGMAASRAVHVPTSAASSNAVHVPASAASSNAVHAPESAPDARGNERRAGNELRTASNFIREAASGASRTISWTPAERAKLRSFLIDSLGAPPKDPSNKVADDPRAISLGHQLFFDPGLSGSGHLACASCHAPAHHFADGKPRAVGEVELGRNTPSVVGAAYAPFQFWDGRRDSLWSQALVPLEAAGEMNATRVEVVRHIAKRYAKPYAALFGIKLPTGLPRRASPTGDEAARQAWDMMRAEQQEAVNRAFANIGKLLAAYQRQLKPGRAAFDVYVDAVLKDDATKASAALSPRAEAGLKLFLSEDAQCTRCHLGPLFSNGGFHNIGTGTPDGDAPDFGRSIGIQALLSTEFNCRGPFNDDPARKCPELDHLDRHEENGKLVGAYKVPTLRGVARTAPYMHDGRFASLREVMGHYQMPKRMNADNELRPLIDWSPERLEAVSAFLDSLSAPVDAPEKLLQPPR
jgi:cytochrome c peroxidase